MKIREVVIPNPATFDNNKLTILVPIGGDIVDIRSQRYEDEVGGYETIVASIAGDEDVQHFEATLHFYNSGEEFDLDLDTYLDTIVFRGTTYHVFFTGNLL